MLNSAKHWFVTMIVSMMAINSSTVDAVAQEGRNRNMFADSLPLSVMQIVGEIAGVNQNIDMSYTNFYLTGIHIAIPGHNVNIKEFDYLDQHTKYYVLTALRSEGAQLIQRTFIIGENLISELGLNSKQLRQLQNGQLGDIYPSRQSSLLITQRQFNFPSVGQYLRDDSSQFSYAIYPRVVYVVSEPANSDVVANIKSSLSKGYINADYRIHSTFQ